MRTRKLMLAVAVLAVAGLAASPLLGEAFQSSTLTALDPVAQIGSTADLAIDVDALLVGGTAELYIETPDGTVISQGDHALTDTHFVITTPVPSWGTPGMVVRYYFRSYDAAGAYFDTSNGALVLLATGSQGTDEPPIWD